MPSHTLAARDYARGIPSLRTGAAMRVRAAGLGAWLRENPPGAAFALNR